ncbi:LLM class flavin-dependent oxidoreductase [Herbiconiux sp. VKM Ac-2851]|uniref:LLM class flavin-dependent oxidoreductase n=1 Tax=Herbiconiux sp. VKM Ac-2851 TaxID=2739025 RepID=UPI00156496DD|nr:LLM class flavin-dependent oxidoreductase [Herbiconiux sp. VKM Ac-2851]NQX36371.1 LLM class flavin-dependent oxidoreductase [Herbiconiux sp. VKM Ac-2851]
MTALSVLDLIPVRSGQTTGDAVAASLALAQAADRLGYTRYWMAEHHNMPSVASTSPATLIAHFAAGTARIRLGSGGVMLPNHAALTVAEQFALLEAIHPGRIDLGLGRAPGSDPVTAYMLRGQRSTTDTDPAASFPTDVEAVAALLGSDRAADLPFGDEQPGVGLTVGGRSYELKATPRSTSAPELWLLGSSDYSAALAAKLGTAYVFANHFGQPGIDRALALYRDGFQPSEALAAPKTLLTVNISVAATAEEARRRALPQLIAMARLRTGGVLGPQLTVEEAEATALSPMEEQSVLEQERHWLIGTADEVEARIRSLTERHGVDEVMVSPVAGSLAADGPRETPARVEALQLLATRFPELSQVLQPA